MRKELLATLLAMSMTMTMLPGVALAAEDVPGDANGIETTAEGENGGETGNEGENGGETGNEGENGGETGNEGENGDNEDDTSDAEKVATEETLRNALAKGGNVVLTENIAVTGTLTISRDTVLNLNGNRITGSEERANRGVIEIEKDANVTIENGTVRTNEWNSYVIYVLNGKVTLENCTIINGDSDDAAVAIRVAVSGKLNIDNATKENVIGKIVYDKEETYYISVPSVEGGEVIPSARYAAEDDRVTLSVHPEDGYELADLEVKDIRGRTVSTRNTDDNTYSFTMPSAQVTVTAEFAKKPDPYAAAPDDEIFTGLGTPGISGIVLNPSPMPFLDVQGGDWYYSSVEYVWKHYLMSGVSDTQFSPNETTSRAMVWTILARMNNIRTDVNPGSTWYERGMVWAIEHGVTDGSDPMGTITREQLATMLWRNAGAPGGSGADMSQFSDFGSVSDYAQTAVRWAVGRGILKGTDGRLNPQGTATRAEVAAMVARYTG